jgi:hypothetical protein
MSVQVVQGVLKSSDGRSVPLSTSLTDGSDSQELLTNSTYTVTSQSVGRYCDGWTLTKGWISCATNICYAYLLRNGQVIANIPSMSSNAIGSGAGMYPLSHPVRIIPGDQVLIRVEA